MNGKKRLKLIITPEMGHTDAPYIGTFKKDSSGKNIFFAVRITFPKTESPGWWYIQANSFHTAFSVLKNKIDTTIDNSVPAIPTIYLWGVALELYLKTFLLHSGYKVGELEKYKHNLIKLRNDCSKINSNFNHEELCYLIENIGPLIRDKGGIRYPIENANNLAIYDPLMQDSLIFLDSIIAPLLSIEYPTDY